MTIVSWPSSKRWRQAKTAAQARAPGLAHKRWYDCRRWLSGTGGAGSVAREPGEARVHARRGGEGGLSLRWLVDGGGGEAVAFWHGGGVGRWLQ
jgi:hypothetical protein